MADRSKRIRQNIQNVMGDIHGTGPGRNTIVYDAMNRIQRRIAEECNAIEDSEEIELISDIELYDVPDNMIAERFIMSTGSVPLEKKDLKEIDQMKRNLANTDSLTNVGNDAYYYYRWANQFGFLRVDGSAGATSTVTVYYYRSPDFTTEYMSDTVDPTVDRRWDTALFYGSVAELLHDQSWILMFEAEVQRQKRIQNSTNVFTADVAVTRSYD